MNKFILKAAAIQIAITLTWLAIVSYEFVESKDGNPIQFGLIEWVIMIIQFFITLAVGLLSHSKGKDKKLAKKRLLTSLLVVAVILSLSLAFDRLLWDWLWRLRKEYV